MKKVLITATTAYMVAQFNIKDIKRLINLGYKVDVATNFQIPGPISNEKLRDLKNFLKDNDVGIFQVNFSRKPFSINNIKSFFQLNKIIFANKYEFVHTHTPISSAITRMIASVYSLRAIYTAHGFHFYNGAPLKNWIIYYPIEKIFSYVTDTLITLNDEDYNFSKKFLSARTNIKVNGVGIPVEKFTDIFVENDPLRSELNIKNDDVILISVGELNNNKNHLSVMEAIKKINEKNIKYFVVGTGENYDLYSEYIKENDLENNITLLGYRTDIPQLLNLCDIFIFPSKREGLSVALMEAMASKLPIIASNIRGNRDLIIHGEGGYLFNIDDNDLIESYIKILSKEPNLRNQFGFYNLERVKNFSEAVVNEQMNSIYNQIGNNRKK
ncbi:glycosyltransferase family 4 protein [Streptococcus uberis]|uniref:glycosyltransferase family 4 protein n=1 Tax=Streptococcus uberis TaxID=1349 RepID=UPI001FF68334|nr:glycosyltransferase family 4 protein [Streptococcus uberis]MCK1233072.1 glycosyltransferase family 4 protein [Streptococcus uberis]MCK1250706.1 glycosyltransferase family 4 protein [Streptococcus uberis]